jgi:hypothetical protein
MLRVCLFRNELVSADLPVPPPPSGGHSGPSALQNTPLEFAESTAVNLEWRLSGLKEMYNVTKGEAKS